MKKIKMFRKAEAVLLSILLVTIIVSGTVTITDTTMTTTESSVEINYADGWIRMDNGTIDNNSVTNAVINTWLGETGFNASDSIDMDDNWWLGWNASNNTNIRNSNGKYWSATGANIQLALDDGEVTVTLPTGNISIGTKLTIGTNDKLIGQRNNKTILFRADGLDDSIIENSDTTNGNYGIALEGIRFEGNGFGQTPVNPISSWQSLIHFDECSDVTIKDCYINNSMNLGILFDDGNNSRIIDNTIAYSGKYFIDNPTSGWRPSGICMYNVNNSIVSRNIVRHTFSVGIAWETSDSSQNSQGWIISDNVIYGCFAGIWVETVRNGTISGNTISKCWNTTAYDYVNIDSVGIMLGGGNSGIDVVGNTVFDINHSGIGEGDGIIIGNNNRYITVDSNSVSNADGYGISTQCTDSTISNNVLNNISSTGLRVYGNRNSVTGNVLNTIGASGLYIDSADVTAGGCIFSNNIFTDIAGVGINTYIDDCIISSNIINNTGSYGIRNYADNCIISLNNIEGVLYDGIILITANNCTLIGNKLFDNDDANDGIEIQDSSNCTVAFNNIWGFTDAIDETRVCANNIIKYNIGYTTESSGLCTIDSGDNSVIVNHNMSIKPTSMRITPRDNLTAASFWYVDTITATQFTLHVNAQVTADVGFWWKAEA